jgi:hypothetical protein
MSEVMISLETRLHLERGTGRLAAAVLAITG